MTTSDAMTFVINASWQAIFFAGVAALASRLMRGGPARARHLVYVGALVASFVAPLVRVVRPHGAWTATMAPAPVATHVSRWPTALLVLAGVAVAWRCLRLLVALWRTGLVARGVRHAMPVEVQQAAARAASLLGVTRYRLVAGAIAGPVTLGLVNPLIILPAALARPDAGELLGTAVGHELAHVRRRDFFWNLVIELVALPLSFHPAVWFLKRRIDETRELACDELVIDARLVERKSYAHSLVKLADAALTAGPGGYALGAVAPPLLAERIHSLVRERPVPKRAPGLVALAMLVTSAVLGARMGLVVPRTHSAADWLQQGRSACAAGNADSAEEALTHLDEYTRADLLIDCASSGMQWCESAGFHAEQP